MQPLPPEVARFREPVLDRVLEPLPDEILSALAHGLERHAGQLVAGRLYERYDGGGCAVGVMLRELKPEAYREGRLAFRIRRQRHRSILTERLELESGLVTRLSHVEMCFDRTALTLSQDGGPADLGTAANVTGRWMAEGCRRRLHARNRSFFVPESWRPRRLRPVAARAASPTRRMIGHDGTVTRVAVRAPSAHEMPLPV